MHRIDNSTAATSLPTPAAAGTPGYFTAGSPSSGIPATIVDPDWMNDFQEEAISILTAAGITPDKTVHNQLATALQTLFGTGVSKSLATNGYVKEPSGLIKQWGYATGTSTGAPITFPIAFPNAVTYLGGSPLQNAGSYASNILSVTVAANSVSKTGATFYTDEYNGAFQSDNNLFYWLAEGY